jgi:hypothetical protein
VSERVGLFRVENVETGLEDLPSVRGARAASPGGSTAFRALAPGGLHGTSIAMPPGGRMEQREVPMSDSGCPICHDGVLERVDGRLDQSGDSYLPTIVWRCPRCEYSRFEPAVRVRWRPAAEQPSELPSTEERPVEVVVRTRHAA